MCARWKTERDDRTHLTACTAASDSDSKSRPMRIALAAPSATAWHAAVTWPGEARTGLCGPCGGCCKHASASVPGSVDAFAGRRGDRDITSGPQRGASCAAASVESAVQAGGFHVTSHPGIGSQTSGFAQQIIGSHIVALPGAAPWSARDTAQEPLAPAAKLHWAIKFQSNDNNGPKAGTSPRRPRGANTHQACPAARRKRAREARREARSQGGVRRGANMRSLMADAVPIMALL